MFHGTRACAFLVATLLITSITPGQEKNSSIQSVKGRIYLDVVVTPKSGSPVIDLQQQDFTLFDNNVPQTIATFQIFSARQAKLGFVLVIDAVNASYQNVARQRIEIDKFLRAEGGQLAFPVALVLVTDKGNQVIANFSSDGNALSAVLDREDSPLRTIGRSGGGYAALDRWHISLEAMHHLDASVAGPPWRTVVIWVSPGWPLLSGPNIQLSAKDQQQIFTEIVSFANQTVQSKITLYSVDPLGAGESLMRASYYEEFLKGISRSDQTKIGNLGLPVLAVQSGGLALYSSNDIAGMLQECTVDAARFYEISFDPAPAGHPDEYHHLEVKLAKPGLTARTHQGYYAQPSVHD
jgi:VWFA-related protein